MLKTFYFIVLLVFLPAPYHRTRVLLLCWGENCLTVLLISRTANALFCPQFIMSFVEKIVYHIYLNTTVETPTLSWLQTGKDTLLWNSHIIHPQNIIYRILLVMHGMAWHFLGMQMLRQNLFFQMTRYVLYVILFESLLPSITMDKRVHPKVICACACAFMRV
jgi:hypothetical protein